MKKIKFKEWSEDCSWHFENLCLKDTEKKCNEKDCRTWHLLDDFKYDNAKK